MRIHFIQQDSWVKPGEYLAWAERHKYPVSYTRCWLYEQVPTEADADMLVVFGGYQNPATTKEECDYFDAEAEKELIRKYAEAGRIVIGVCLGAQLMGEAFGANYEHSPEREIGAVLTRKTEEGKADPFMKSIPDTFYSGQFHSDMPGLTKDSVVLAESAGCPRQIIRYGKYIYGFQAHMEFTHDIIVDGMELNRHIIEKGGRFVQSEEELMAFDYSEMNRQLSGFLDALTESLNRS